MSTPASPLSVTAAIAATANETRGLCAGLAGVDSALTSDSAPAGDLDEICRFGRVLYWRRWRVGVGGIDDVGVVGIDDVGVGGIQIASRLLKVSTS